MVLGNGRDVHLLPQQLRPIRHLIRQESVQQPIITVTFSLKRLGWDSLLAPSRGAPDIRNGRFYAGGVAPIRRCKKGVEAFELASRLLMLD